MSVDIHSCSVIYLPCLAMMTYMHYFYQYNSPTLNNYSFCNDGCVLDREDQGRTVVKHPLVNACPTLIRYSVKMSLCCLCNKNGTCHSCACVKVISLCSNCLPSRLHRCQNVQVDVAYDDPSHDNLNQSQSVPSLPLCRMYHPLVLLHYSLSILL